MLLTILNLETKSLTFTTDHLSKLIKSSKQEKKNIHLIKRILKKYFFLCKIRNVSNCRKVWKKKHQNI